MRDIREITEEMARQRFEMDFDPSMDQEMSMDRDSMEAELQLRRREPHPALVAIALGLLMYLVSSGSANAAPVAPASAVTGVVQPESTVTQPVAKDAAAVPAITAAAVPVNNSVTVQAESQDGCSTHLKTLQFAGTFKLKTADAKARPMRFVIGFPPEADSDSKNVKAVAQIWSGNRCQASCSSLDFEKGDLSVPISLDLQCRGEELGPLSAHVAVLWDQGSSHSGNSNSSGSAGTVLRFGSWLEGYEQADVKVEVDRFNSKDIASRAEMPSGASKRRAVAFRVLGIAER